MLTRAAFLVLVLSGAPAFAAEPLSAIDWLSQSVQEIATTPDPNVDEDGAAISGVTENVITVTPLDQIKKDAVGLLPPSQSGLPRNFWGDTTAEVLQDLIGQQNTDSLPEIQSLLYSILLAEVDAPPTISTGSDLLLARVDKLLDLGALEQAQALLERAGPTEPEIFRRWFDVSLLTGQEDHACKAMAAAPGFAPTLQARVFCLARNGDWNAAALTLATGESLGFISKDDADLMAWFLDPGLFEGAADLPQPERLTPLIFTMREAIAQPRPTGALPRAFLYADLRPSSAWRNQIIAAERLARTGALEFPLLLALYTEKKPAASGGVWNRVSAVQAFDVALISGDVAAIAASLGSAMEAMEQIHLSVPFSIHYGDRLAAMNFAPTERDTALRIALLSRGYEAAGIMFKASDSREKLVLGVARGRVGTVPTNSTALEGAITDAFLRPLPSGPLFNLLQQNRLGEAVLRAMLLLNDEAQADPGDIQRALATFRAVGLEEEARRIAIQLLILERRG